MNLSAQLHRASLHLGLLTALCGALFLSACGEKKSTVLELPKGVQTMTGTLLPAEISMARRGTHLIRIQDTDTYYAESSTVSLQKYEGKRVVLEGTLEHNIEPRYYPVLVVSSVERVLEEKKKSWQFYSLGLSLEAPESWGARAAEGKATLLVPGAERPVITIEFEPLPEEEIVGGTPLVLDSERAVRLIDENTGEQRVILERSGKLLVFSFNPTGQEHSDILRETWLTILTSVQLDDVDTLVVEDPENTATGSTVSAEGRPCGGPAGILCPQNFYCDVEHLQENIGVCKRL